jgi:hypothetical protein
LQDATYESVRFVVHVLTHVLLCFDLSVVQQCLPERCKLRVVIGTSEHISCDIGKNNISSQLLLSLHHRNASEQDRDKKNIEILSRKVLFGQ